MSGSVRVALALGSGGARGYAHIGVIQVLEERGAEIVGIAGSSMGALVGGVRAAGKLDEYTEWAVGMSQFDVLRMLDPSLTASGAIRAEKIVGQFRELLGGALIEDLPIPFTAVATDLATRKEVWFQRGPADVAIRASIAIPGIFPPVMLNGRLLVDGAITDPVPIAPTISAGAELTIGVSLSGDRRGTSTGAPAAVSAEARPFDEWAERFRRGASFLLDRELVRSLLSRFGRDSGLDVDGDAEADSHVVQQADLSKYDVMSQSLDVMQHLLARYRLAAYPPDLLITVPKDACRTFDFHRAKDLVELGRVLTEEALDKSGLLPRRALGGVAAGAVGASDAIGVRAAGAAGAIGSGDGAPDEPIAADDARAAAPPASALRAER